MPGFGMRNILAPMDRSWLVLAATTPFWVLLVLNSHGFIAPDICFSPTSDTIERVVLGVAIQFGWGGPASPHLLTWLLMVAATSIPSIWTMAQYVAVRSFRERRVRSVGIFVLGYAMPWLCALPAAIAILTGLSVILPRDTVGVASFAVAASWYLSPVAGWVWRHRHSAATIAVHGYRADLSALRCGIRHGAWCAAWCGPLMAATLSLPNHAAAMALTWPILLLQQAKLAPPARTALSIMAAGIALALSDAYLAHLFPR